MKTAQVPIGGIDYDTHDYLVATDNGVVRDSAISVLHLKRVRRVVLMLP